MTYDFSKTTWGWKGATQPRPPDPRDRKFGVNINPLTLPIVVDWTSKCAPARAQRYGDCVGHATRGAYELLQAMSGQVHTDLSALAIYNWCRSNPDGTITAADDGTYVATGVSVIRNIGDCRDSLFDEGHSPMQPPPPQCKVDAANHRIVQYLSIRQLSTLYPYEDDICAAIAAGYPVIIGVGVYSSFMYAPGGVCPMPDPAHGDMPMGGHAIYLCGYDRSDVTHFYKFQTSWGTGWGVNGFGWLHRDFGKGPIPNIGDPWVIQTDNEPLVTGNVMTIPLLQAAVAKLVPGQVTQLLIDDVKTQANALVVDAPPTPGFTPDGTVYPPTPIVVATGTWTLGNIVSGSLRQIRLNGITVSGAADRLTQVSGEVRAWQDSTLPGVSWRWDGASWQRV